MLLGEFAQRLQVALCRRNHAHVARNRFDDLRSDFTGIFLVCFLNRLGIVVGNDYRVMDNRLRHARS